MPQLYFNENRSPLSLINIASVYGVVAPRFKIYENTSLSMPAEYAAIKAAIIHLTKYFCKYINHENFRVNCVSPGGILDDHDADFVSSYAEFIAGSDLLMVNKLLPTFLHLLGEESHYINGQNIIIDQGLYSLVVEIVKLLINIFFIPKAFQDKETPSSIYNH